MKNTEVIDSYEVFLNHFNINKEAIYEFGLSQTIFPSIEQVEIYWEDLKLRLFNNKLVYIRGYGRDAHGTELYKELHKEIFANENIKKDPSNNYKPQRIIESMTGFRKGKTLLNYQVSHIFGKTRNALLFEAPWNIALVPKIIDPLTGHESKGDWGKEYQDLFLGVVTQRYSHFIQEYNEICEEYISEEILDLFTKEKAPNIIGAYSESNKQKTLFKNFCTDFSKIEISTEVK